MFKKTITLMAIIVVACLTGCATRAPVKYDDESYPNTWPKIITDRECKNILGNFSTRGKCYGYDINTEGAQIFSTRHINIFHGKDKPHPDSKFAEINLTTGSMVYKIYNKDNALLYKKVNSPLNWRCIEGRLETDTNYTVGGDGSSQAVSVHTTYANNEQSDLIIRFIEDATISYLFGLIKEKVVTEVWCKFKRVVVLDHEL